MPRERPPYPAAGRAGAMAHDADKPVLRLPKKYAGELKDRPDPDYGRRLETSQSLCNALAAGLLAALTFAVLCLAITAATGRVLPFLTALSGLPIGYAVQRAGRGLDWRFPALAGALAIAGALAGNVLIAAANTAGELGTNLWRIIGNVTPMTWSVFFEQAMTGADYVYALAAAGIAAYYAKRRLSRRQFFAWRSWQQRRE